MSKDILIPTNKLPDWVRTEIKNYNAKPEGIDVAIGSIDPLEVQNYIERLETENKSRNIMQWAIERNTKLIQYTKTALSKNPNSALVYLNGHDGQTAIIYENGETRSLRGCYNESWANSSEIEQMISSGFNYVIKPGEMVLTHYTYYGHGRTHHRFRLLVHPNDFSSLQIEAPKQLTKNEKIVLCATRSVVNSYAGNNNYRYTEANYWTKISLEDYNQAQADLLAKGFLKKAGKGLSLALEGKALADGLNLYNLARE